MTTSNRKIADSKPGPQQARLAEMLRVDHAGEYGAVAIYRGQRAVFAKLPKMGAVDKKIEEMADGETEHLETFDRLLKERNIRPSLLSPLWNAAGFGLGAATALLGEKAAMTCTSAVEEVIEKHYAKQAEYLKETEPELSALISRFRDDEIAHKQTADDANADAGRGLGQGLGLLGGVIRMGCRAAIKIAEKV